MPCLYVEDCGEEVLCKCEVVVCVHFLFLTPPPPHSALVLHVTLQRFDLPEASPSCRTSLFCSPQLGKHVFEMLL